MLLRGSRSLTALLLLLGTSSFAATDVAQAIVHVTIRPAVSARVLGSELSLAIRLAPQTHGLVWKGEDCRNPAADAYAISASGSYTIPLSEVTGEGSRICVRSTDSSLSMTIFR